MGLFRVIFTFVSSINLNLSRLFSFLVIGIASSHVNSSFGLSPLSAFRYFFQTTAFSEFVIIALPTAWPNSFDHSTPWRCLQSFHPIRLRCGHDRCYTYQPAGGGKVTSQRDRRIRRRVHCGAIRGTGRDRFRELRFTWPGIKGRERREFTE